MRTIWSLSCLLLLAGCQSASRNTGPVTRTIQTPDDVSIVYDVRGRGDTALVFVHCWSCDRAFWHEQVDELADRYRVVAMDLPGHGESGANRASWSIAELARDVQTVVEKLKLKRVILVGHSMGGPVVVEAARRMPGRVIGIVLVDTMQDVEFEFPRAMAEQFASRFEADFEGTLREMVPAMFPKGAEPALIDWVITRAMQTDRAAAVALMRAFPDVDARASFRAAGVPIRAINATPWETSGMKTAVETNRQYADYDVVLMEGVGHYVQLERPQEFNEHLRAIVASIDGE